MSLRIVAVLAFVLASSVVAWPGKAEAKKAKSPLWAIVAADGTLIRGNGAIKAFVYPAPGAVHVDFDRDVSDCAIVASTTGGYAGQTGVNGGNGERIHVYTADSAGNAAALPFHVIVACPK
jgi:hypothetical protein